MSSKRYSDFPLFKSHLDLAHQYWEKLVLPGDIVIDATCGNGHDTLRLAQLALKANTGQVYAYDIQSKAIEATQEYITKHLEAQQLPLLHFEQKCHSKFSPDIQPETVRLIVYNLGYLPKGDKTLTTQTETTLQSLKEAMRLIMPGGAISITCYPGHLEGAIEEEAILIFAASLNVEEWSCCHHRLINRSKAPSLLLIQKTN